MSKRALYKQITTLQIHENDGIITYQELLLTLRHDITVEINRLQEDNLITQTHNIIQSFKSGEINIKEYLSALAKISVQKY